MSAKNYEAIAAILKERFELDGVLSHGAFILKGLSHDLADYFEKENPRFDRDSFLKACGHPDYQIKEKK